jgi:hypothetical protein
MSEHGICDSFNLCSAGKMRWRLRFDKSTANAMPGDLRLFSVVYCARCIRRPRRHQFFRSAIELAADRCLKRKLEQNSQKYVSGHTPLARLTRALFLACAVISN